jgi:long-chain fatty acid transport protein
MLRRYSKWLTTFLLLACPGTAWSLNGMNPLGFGARSVGMGGVGVALPQDGFAAALNPAGLNYVTNRLDVGFGWIFQKGESIYRQAILPPIRHFGSHHGIWLPQAALCWNLYPRHVVGVALYPNGTYFTSYATPLPGFGTTPAKGLLYELFLTPSWSWRVNCIHSLGVAVNIAIGWFERNGFEDFASLSFFPNDVTNRGVDTNNGVSVRVGWLGELPGCLKIGATIQTKTWCTVFKKYQGLFPDEGAFSLPPEAALGISWLLSPTLTLSADLLYRFWDNVPAFSDPSRTPASVDTAFGSLNGPGLGWTNQIVLKLGLSWQMHPWFILRIGYNYSANPVCPSDTAINQFTLATIDNHVTCGVTYSWKYAECTLYYWHGFDRIVSGISSSPLVGVAEIDVRNRQDSVGVTYTRFF